MSSLFTLRVPAGRFDWEAVRSRVDLATVAVAWLGPPQQRRGDGRGRRLWWTCPFHPDRNPSLSVEPDKPTWRCWGCGAHGDAATLVMKLDGSTFPEAVRRLAATCGVDAEASPRPRPAAPVTPAAKPVEGPSGIPVDDALRLIEDAAARLWSEAGRIPSDGDGTEGLAERASLEAQTLAETGPDGDCRPEAGEVASAPDRIRTYNLRFRRPMLYPIELRVRV